MNKVRHLSKFPRDNLNRHHHLDIILVATFSNDIIVIYFKALAIATWSNTAKYLMLAVSLNTKTQCNEDKNYNLNLLYTLFALVIDL